MSLVVLPFTDRFALIIAGLCQALAVRSARDRALAPMGLLLWARLNRMLRRFRSLVARGGMPGRPSAPRPVRTPERKSATRWPRGFASLVRLVPEAAAYGTQLQALLSEPDMAALLAHSPQARRTLRPLCQMLGVRPDPTLLPPPARPSAASRPVVTAPAALSPEPSDNRAADPPMAQAPPPDPTAMPGPT